MSIAAATQPAPSANGSAANNGLTVVEVSEEKAKFDMVAREANALAHSVWTPDHLLAKDRNNVINWDETRATCIGLVLMAQKWNMSPNMVAGETYSVRGKIGFQGKLYAALANAHGSLVGGLRAIYSGTGENLASVIFGSDHELTDEDKQNLKKLVKDGNSDAATDLELAGVRAVRLLFSQCKTDQQMWKKDPEQKIFYTGATKWCRKFMPDLVLGVISVDDIEREAYEQSEGFNGKRIEKQAGIVVPNDSETANEPDNQSVLDEYEQRLSKAMTVLELSALRGELVADTNVKQSDLDDVIERIDERVAMLNEGK